MTELSFASRESALDWVIDHQLGRRNITPEQKAYYRGKKYNREKRDREENLTQNVSMGQNVPSVPVERTSSQLASEFKVDEKTIRRDAAFASAVDTLAENGGGLVGPSAYRLR